MIVTVTLNNPAVNPAGLVGAWGPVVTPVLLHKGIEPRYAVGSLSTPIPGRESPASRTLMAGI